MVPETKKKSASFDSDNAAGVKVGGGTPSNGSHKLQMAPLRPNTKKILAALVFVGLAAGFWFIYGNHFGERVYAQAAGHKIYEQDVKDLIGKNKGISDHNAAEILADKYLYEAMAKEYDIRITDQDIRTAYGSIINQQKTQNKYAYQSRVNDLYYEKLQENNQGIYKGYLLAAHFNRNIELQPQPENQQSFPTNAGNPAAIAADKQYAKDFITNLYNQVKARKITWDQAAQMERADLQIGLNMYPSLTHSGPFDTSKTTNSLLIPPSALQEIQKLKPGQTSKPFVVSVTTTVGSSNKHFESYFLVVRMDSATGGGKNRSFLQEMTQAKQKFGYKVYV